jgi:hypothetical protein
VVVWARVVFAEPGVDKDMVRWLIVDPKEKELSWLETRLELEGDNLEGDCLCGQRLQLGCNCLEERAHLASTII